MKHSFSDFESKHKKMNLHKTILKTSLKCKTEKHIFNHSVHCLRIKPKGKKSQQTLSENYMKIEIKMQLRLKRLK